MAVYQISRIQHRRGTSGELPNALEDGEIGMTTDTGEVFIGAQTHPSVSGRKSYPYQNIKLLTELDIQRGIGGDVYYHGPLVSAVCGSNSNMTSVFPLFVHNERDFATYDFSLYGNGGSVKLMGIMTVCVHPSDPDQSVVNLAPGSMCSLNWPGGSANLPTSTTGHFQLTRYDLTGADTGITWLAFRNNFGLELTLSLSGREWSAPEVDPSPPTQAV